METFGWTGRFCSLPGVPAGAGPCLPVLLWPLAQGAAEGLSVGALSVVPASTGAVARKLAPASLLLPLQAGARVCGAWRWEAGGFVAQGWDDMLDWGLCRSFPGVRGVL